MALGGRVRAGAGRRRSPARIRAGFGPLTADPGGLLDLPAGFHYRVVQTVADRLTSGAPVSGDFDGMTAIAGRRGSTMLVRNHELRPTDLATKSPVIGRTPYDANAPGGTTAVVVGPDRRTARSFVTSSGTMNDCAGGGTPWGDVDHLRRSARHRARLRLRSGCLRARRPAIGSMSIASCEK
jgi:secreted PhoX family phosphatase